MGREDGIDRGMEVEREEEMKKGGQDCLVITPAFLPGTEWRSEGSSAL